MKICPSNVSAFLIALVRKWCILLTLTTAQVSSLSFVFADEYQTFNQFALANFGAEQEPLVYQIFGSTLKLMDTGNWTHESRNSASISFETNLPAKSFIEYGPTSTYGQTTSQTDRYYYTHLHYLTGLSSNTTYHYRLVVIDERGNRLESPDKTVQTQAFSQAVSVPGSLAGPPYVLNQSNTLYILTQNINSNTRGITIKGNNITLDLNGFTITYDQGTPLITGAWNDYLYSDISTIGVYPSGNNLRVLNGTIRQGANNGTGDLGMGFNPLVSEGSLELAGVTAEWSGHSVSGIESHWGTLNAHHNVIIDRGTGIGDRHLGIKAIYTDTVGSGGIHHNLVKRIRHQGIVPNTSQANIFSNEIYQDSWATNAFGIKPSAQSQIYQNKLFGTGYHVNSVGWSTKVTIRDNFVFLQGVAPSNRSSEYGNHCSVNGFRLTQYGGSTVPYEDNLYEGNTIIVKGREGCQTLRGVQFSSDPYVKNLVFRNNTIKTEVQDNITPIAPCVVGHGLSERAEQQLPVLYQNNTLISNTVHVRFNDDYAAGGSHHFKNNTFRKFGSRDDYRTINIGYWIWDSYKNLFIDSTLEGGASLGSYNFDGTGKRDYSVGHSLYIIARNSAAQPIANQTVSVRDNLGVSYSTQTDSLGKARLELLEHTREALVNQSSPSLKTRSDHKIEISGYPSYTVSPQIFSVSNNTNGPVIVTFGPGGGALAPPAAPSSLRVAP